MKLVPQKSGENFYESFSDIIFATMAIFVLLMTIFISLIHEHSPISQARAKLAAIESEIEQKTQEEAELDQQTARLKASVSQLSKRDVEIFIIVDRTGSMEEELYLLKQSILRLAAILPKVTDSVKIGVASYWASDRNNRPDIRLFPMTRIVDSEDDNGRSLGQLKGFMDQQRHSSGHAPILKAAQTALSQLSPPQRFNGHQVLMILGDVGPYEESRNSDAITSAGKTRANQLVSTVSGWVQGRKDRNLIVLFSGLDEIRSPQWGSARQRKHATSRDLFKRIAQASGQPDGYTENKSTMLTDFLIAALKRK